MVTNKNSDFFSTEMIKFLKLPDLKKIYKIMLEAFQCQNCNMKKYYLKSENLRKEEVDPQNLENYVFLVLRKVCIV